MFNIEDLTEAYQVIKKDTGEVVTGCAVLRPDIDSTARAALWVYADTTDNLSLAQDIYSWIHYIQSLQGDD